MEKSSFGYCGRNKMIPCRPVRSLYHNIGHLCLNEIPLDDEPFYGEINQLNYIHICFVFTISALLSQRYQIASNKWISVHQRCSQYPKDEGTIKGWRCKLFRNYNLYQKSASRLTPTSEEKAYLAQRASF